MTRELEDETYYFVKRKGAIPVKWTAPEAIYYKKYSTSSDIWSFGMLMFEIWSLGLCPFGELSHKMVVKMLQKPYCQSPPPGCPRAVYSIMVKCWATERSQRPTADDLSRIYFAADNQALLAWSDEDRSTGPESDVLGSPLERGSQLYLDLQHCYA
jgi:serine/threonine protein kinase